MVYAKPPFGGPDQGLNYLGRHTHRRQKLALCRQLLGAGPSGERREASAESPEASCKSLTGESFPIGPACRQGRMAVIEVICLLIIANPGMPRAE